MTRAVEDILGRDSIAAVRRPIAEARGLPVVVAYTATRYHPSPLPQGEVI